MAAVAAPPPPRAGFGADMAEYIGTTYIGVVGSDLDYGISRDSIERIYRTPDDTPPQYIRATKGYEARQMHLNNFIASQHEFILFLDADMVFERDTLSRLRSHKLPYITGAYMRRQYEPVMAPVWFDYNESGEWPYSPATSIPEELAKVGASGWGCVLVHREVILAVRRLLKGEQEILEDDMDVWPYDLKRVMLAIGHLKTISRRPLSKALAPYVIKYVDILADEIRPLRIDKSGPVGSDIRFPFFAKQAGFDLWLDPQVMPGHIIHYPVKHTDYLGAGDEYVAEVQKVNTQRVADARKEYHKQLKEYGAE